MNIIYISNRKYPTHDSRIVEIFTKYLPDTEYDVLVLAKAEARYKNIHKWNNSRIAINAIRDMNIPFPFSYLYHVAQKILYYVFIIRSCSKYKPKYIIIGNDTNLTILLSKIFRNGFIIYEKNFPDEEYNYHFSKERYRNKPIIRYIQEQRIKRVRIAIEQAFKTIVMSESMVQYYATKHNIKDTGIIRALPMGIVPLPYTNNTKKYDVCYVGELISQRRPDFIIDVVMNLYKLYPPVKILLVGANDDEHVNTIRKMMYDRNIPNSTVKITKWVARDKVSKYIKMSRVGISPIPDLELFRISDPTKLIEYMNCGIPVVANKEIFNQKLIIDNAKAGYAVNYKPLEFAEAIHSLLRMSSKERDKIGKRGYEYVSKFRDYSYLTNQFKAILKMA